MNYFGIAFMIIIGFGFLRAMKEMKSEMERLRIELGISENDPSNESLSNYLMTNRFQFLMILFMIFFSGVMVTFFLIGR